jgi:hypothetical protein
MDENEDPLFREYGAAVGPPAYRRRKKHARHVGFPWEFLVDVVRLTSGRTALIVAVYVYRRTVVTGSKAVTLVGSELADLSVRRDAASRALATLEAAGLVKLNKRGVGRRTEIELLWKGRGAGAT